MVKQYLNFRILKKLLLNLIIYINDLIIYFLLVARNTNDLDKLKNTKLRIVSGCDSSHFRSMLQLCNSVLNCDDNLKITIYDLGLTISEIQQLKKLNNVESIKEFNFNNYPKFMKLSSPNAGAYAWKPMIIEKEMNFSEELLVWMDAGNTITKINKLKNYIVLKGFYSPYSSDTVERWTHYKTLKLLNINDNILKKRNLNAAIIGFDQSNIEVINFLKFWIDACKKETIISPIGNNKGNHRWDQSVLTLFFYTKFNPRFFCKSYTFFNVKIHQDVE